MSSDEEGEEEKKGEGGEGDEKYPYGVRMFICFGKSIAKLRNFAGPKRDIQPN